MSETDARNFLVAALRYGRDELANAANMRFPNTVGGGEALLGAIPGSMPQALRDEAAQGVSRRRDAQARLPASGAAGVIFSALQFYGREIDSPHASTIGPELFSDIRSALIAGDYYVAARGNAPASDPTPADGLVLRRLTIDSDAQDIDGGYHNETVTAEVIQTGLTGQGPRQSKIRIYGVDSADDELDYRASGTGLVGAMELELYNEARRSGVISNPSFIVTGAPTNGTAVTQSNLGGWTKSNAEGTPTTVWRTSNPWRSLLGGIAHSGNNTTARYEQPLVLPSVESGVPSAYSPIDLMTVVYWDGTWQGKVRQYWGNKVYEYSSAGFSGAGFKLLLPPANEDLFPVNFSTTGSKFAVEVETDSGSGELVLLHQDLQRMALRQGWWYSAWSHTADPVEGSVKTWQDTCDFTGELQDTLQFYMRQASWAYLPTSGANELVFPPREPDISAEYNGSAVSNSGTIALGSVASGAHDVAILLENTGAAPLAVAPPTSSNDTNASLTGDDVAEPALVILPGDSAVVVVEVTDGGAGAFTIDLSFANNTSGDNPFVVTISGTAT